MSQSTVIGFANSPCGSGTVGHSCSLSGVCNGGWFQQSDCSGSDTYWCCCIPSTTPMSGNTCPPGNSTSFCPVLSGIPFTNSYIPDPNSCSEQLNCKAACVYDVSAFNNPDQVAAFLTAFGNDADSMANFNTFLMPSYCVQQVGTCPQDPITGNTPKTCSRMISTDLNDQYCRQWVNNVNYAAVIQGTMDTYCGSMVGASGIGPNGSTVPNECICVGRFYDPLYRAMSFGQGYVDACWWKPCQNQDLFLIPPQYSIAPGTCPNNICSQAINAFNDNNLNVTYPDSSFYISCNFGGSGGTGGGDGGGSGSNFLNELFTFVREHEVWFIVGIVVIIVLIVLVIWGSSRGGESSGSVKAA